MRVLLIDADSKIPNLALMKLSTFYKAKGANVELRKLNIPFMPNVKKKIHYVSSGYDKILCSVVFEGAANWIKSHNIIFGGSGYSLKRKLPDYIEGLRPDYSIYPDNNVSYGFISRGCPRKCYFCQVPEKEGNIKQVSTVDKIIQHKKVKFLDNNFLALKNHKEILQELMDRKIRCEFNQGLDIRLLDAENSLLLSKLRYIEYYTFAFDDWSYLKLIKKQLKLLSWRQDWKIRFFIYCNPKMSLKNIIKRVEYLKENKCLSYIMRDVSCWSAKYADFYSDFAGWVNQVHLFKKLSFSEFLKKRYVSGRNKTIKRIQLSGFLYHKNL